MKTKNATQLTKASRCLRLLVFALLLFTSAQATNYYWVGGSGNWSDYANHWATSSGGNVYHVQIPSPIDDVFIDANSFLATNDTLTMDTTLLQCRSMDWSGVLNSPHLKLVNNVFSVYGSFILADSMTMRLDSAAIYFKSANQGNAIYTGAHEFNTCNLIFEGNGGWSFVSDFKGTYLAFQKGNLSLGGHHFNVSNFTASATSPNASLDISGATITCMIWHNYAITSSMFFSAASTIHFYSEFWGGKNMHYNSVVVDSLYLSMLSIKLDSTTIDQLLIKNDVSLGVDGNFSSYSYIGLLQFRKPGLSLELQASLKLELGNAVAIGTCTNPINIHSATGGVQATLYKTSGSINFDRVILKDIKATGGASFTANNSYNLGNVSGWVISTPSPRNLFWVGGSGNWSDASHWSLSSGGAGSGCIPGPTDNVMFDLNSFSLAGSEIVNLDLQTAYCNNFVSSGTSSNNVLYNISNNSFNIYGTLQLDTAAPQIPLSLHFLSSGSNTITSSGKLVASNITFNGSGSWTLQDSLSCSSIQLNYGSFITNNFGLSCLGFYSANVNQSPRTIDLGSSNVFAGSWTLFEQNSLTVHADASSITTSYNFMGGRNEHYHILKFVSDSSLISLGDAHIYYYGINDASDSLIIDKLYLYSNTRITGSNIFDSIFVNYSTGYLGFEEGKKQIINGGIISNSACTSSVFISSFSTTGPTSNIYFENRRKPAYLFKPSGTMVVSNAVIKSIEASGGASFSAINSFDAGFNSGWNFTTAPARNLYWVGGSGRWNDPSHWALFSGFPGGECIPNPADNVHFDVNSFSSINDSVVMGAHSSYCNNMDWSAATLSPVLKGRLNYGLRIYGSLTLNSNMTFNPNGELNFESNVNGNTINTQGTKIETSSLNFVGSGAWKQTAALETDKILLFDGTFNTNNQSLKVNFMEAQGAHAKFNLGTSRIECSTLSIFDSVKVDADSSTIFLKKNTLMNGGINSTTTPDVHYHHLIFDQESSFMAGKVDKAIFNTNAAIFSIENRSEYDTLIFNNPGNSIYLYGVQPKIKVNNLLLFKTLPGFPTQMQGQIVTRPGGIDTTGFEMPGGTVCADYLYLTNTVARGGASYYAGIHSSDLGGNTGWNFTSCTPQLSDVWPGDANSDMVANNLDLLNIGLAYGDTGYVRQSASLSWVAQPATDWFWQFISTVNVKHTDCDGNGIVNADDTSAILLNYGLTHPRGVPAQITASPIDPSLYFTLNTDTAAAGSSALIPLGLGTPSVPATDIYGIAFTVNYDKNLVDSGSVKIDFSSCWLGIVDSNIIVLQKDLYSNGKIEAAIVGIDHLNRSGYGNIGVLSVDMKDDISGRDYIYKLLNLNFSNVHLIRNDEIELPLNVVNDSLVVVGDITGIEQQSTENSDVILVPNPAKDNLVIHLGKKRGEVLSYSIYNAFGELMIENKIQNQQTAAVNTQIFAAGVYVIKIKTKEGILTKKLTVIK
ncbi:MAG: T9SS type A sorting domain-containing protein [Bacteroidetes bacterium]|nr:T9SS type A sorting domain-containing protein [Bacteroidota bacterium]